MPRRTATKVKDGRVQKKNNWERARHYSQVAGTELVLDRQRPGKGYRHLVTKRDVERFLALLPDWEELSEGLDAIVLAPGEPDAAGFHCEGVVALCAWERDLHWVTTAEFYEEHRDIAERLGVSAARRRDGVLIRWTEGTARAFQLLHVLLHELGHHHDRMTTRSRRRAARGEPFAEQYARQYGDDLWNAYVSEFGL